MTWWRESFGRTYMKIDVHETTAEEVETIIALLEIEPGAKILDLCCGYGRHAVLLAKKGYSVTGVDVSDLMLEAARTKARSERADIECVAADMRKLPFETKFDAVINLFTSFGYFDAETEDFTVLEEVARVLKKGGTLSNRYCEQGFFAGGICSQAMGQTR
ncbi:MAG: class I SAM-dependent methyltransferase [Actinobacteria bacterium]|nr:class I SAM-dependent methyltransferase [Actinomycetota bacterium]